MARDFGDFCLKDYGLIFVPDVFHRQLTERDEFIVMATDGIWDVISNKEVVDIIASAPNRGTTAKALVESAVRSWRLKYPTSKVDDCVVVCLFLDTEKTSVSSSACNFTKEKEPLIPTDQVEEEGPSGPDGLGHSATVRTVKDILPETSDDELSRDEDQEVSSGTDWSSLEGMTRVNTLVTLPRYVPGKSNKKASGETKPLI